VSKAEGWPGAAPAPAHFAHLDSIRGLSALYVAACHAYLMYAGNLLQEPSAAARGLVMGTVWLSFGRLAVAVFMVLSGYCLMLPVVQSRARAPRPFAEFMSRRARRILPPYFAAVAVSIALIQMVPGLDDPSIGEWHKSFPAVSVGSIASHLSLVHNFFPAFQYSIDHPLWSIATEWQIYFLFPLLVGIGARYGEFRIVTASVMLTVLLMAWLQKLSPDFDPWPAQFVALFGFGMACATWNFPRDAAAAPVDGRRWRTRGVVLLLAGVLSNLAFALTRQQIPDLLVGAGIGCAIVFLTDAMTRGSRAWSLRVLERPSLVGLGRFSYSLYLMHAPVLALFYLVARGVGLGPVAIQVFILGLALPATVAFTYLFHLAFERPFLTPARSAVPSATEMNQRVKSA